MSLLTRMVIAMGPSRVNNFASNGVLANVLCTKNKIINFLFHCTLVDRCCDVVSI